MDKVAEKETVEEKKYTFEEAFDSTKHYFYNNELAANVWCDKYAMRDKEGLFLEKTPDDMHDRLASEFARIDSEKYGLDYNERFALYRAAIDHFGRVVPQGSPMAAVGNTQQIMSASNCVVVEPPEDSIAGIMKTGKELAQLYKRRCGCGTDLSGLRPDGFHVNNAARTTSGAWSFADYYSYITRMIGQSGRRGALMLTLNVHHPDVEKFARMKADLKKVTGANVSIRLSDEFLQAVEDGATYEQRWPCEDDVEPIWTKQVDAKQVWNTIIETATATAEPGLIFWDKITDRLPAHSYPQFKTRSTNPCLTDDTWVLTTKGPQQIKNLLGKRFNAYVDGKIYPSTNKGFFSSGTKTVYRVKTNNGYIVDCTDNHSLKKVTGKTQYKVSTTWAELKDLVIGDEICLQNQRGVSWAGEGTFDEGYLLGQLLGDGTFGGFSEESETKSPYAKLSFWGEAKKQMKEAALALTRRSILTRSDLGSGKEITENEIKYDRVSFSSVGLKKLADRWGIQRYKVVKNELLEKSSSDFHRGLVAGYFDADGSVQGTQQKGVSARISSNNLDNLRMIQRMLSRLGIISSIYENRRDAGLRLLPDGKGGKKLYGCKAMHEIVVSNDNLFTFKELIKFKEPEKIETLNSRLSDYRRMPNRERFTDYIIEIEELEEKPVYDCTIELANYFDANGISVHNCSEIALSSYDSCRLISLNLTGFVRNAFTAAATFDLEGFKDDVRLSMQMIDNLIDIELELIEKIQGVCSTDDERELWQKLWQAGHDGRRTGLGTHGLGDMLAQIGIKYDSQEALDFADRLYETLRDTSYATSIDLAEIRGPFPAFDWDLEKDNEYIRDLPEALRRRMAVYGRRNISILTQAPTGSVSIVSKCGEFSRYNVSSGVEPVFRNKFTRRKKINAGDIHTRVDYTDDLGDTWQNFEVYHGNILNYFEKAHGADLADLTGGDTQKTLTELMKLLPDHFVTSDQVDWKFRVGLQGKEQHWIDHSISSTINLPRGTTSDVVGDIYLSSWRAGLKGVTVYVDGSRDGVLITKEDDKINPNIRPEKIVRIQSPKRPKEMPCDIHQHQVRGEKWTALVGLLDGEPYEMFGGYSNAIHLPKKYTKGTLKRRSRGKYDLIIPVGDGEELIIRDVVGTFNDDDIGWTTRLMSTALRHGTPIPFLTEQLGKSGNITSFSRVLSRVLKKYIPDGEKVKTNVECGRGCDSPEFMYSEGCISCVCGWTKCH
jgi:ribonucleoside-diphosphate reductase alpha chain